MATCPKCKKKIDDDSWYCEHCGEKLYACPQCHTIGKGEGRCCGRCGTMLVEASAAAQAPAPASTPPQQQPASPFAATPVQPQQPQQQPMSPFVATPVQPQQPQRQPSRQATITSPSYSNPVVSTTPATAKPMATTMVCHAMQTRLQLMDGALIGREQGNYHPQLAMFRYVSGLHAQLRLTSGQWTITDLGSRNGTRVNGIPCTPTLPFGKGDIVRLANFYDFIVE